MDVNQQTKSYQPPPLPPRDAVPNVGALPPGSHLPHAANPLFTGREPELLKLAEELLFAELKLA